MLFQKLDCSSGFCFMIRVAGADNGGAACVLFFAVGGFSFTIRVAGADNGGAVCVFCVARIFSL